MLNKKYPEHKIFKKGTEVAKTAPKSAKRQKLTGVANKTQIYHWKGRKFYLTINYLFKWFITTTLSANVKYKLSKTSSLKKLHVIKIFRSPTFFYLLSKTWKFFLPTLSLSERQHELKTTLFSLCSWIRSAVWPKHLVFTWGIDFKKFKNSFYTHLWVVKTQRPIQIHCIVRKPGEGQ